MWRLWVEGCRAFKWLPYVIKTCLAKDQGSPASIYCSHQRRDSVSELVLSHLLIKVFISWEAHATCPSVSQRDPGDRQHGLGRRSPVIVPGRAHCGPRCQRRRRGTHRWGRATPDPIHGRKCNFLVEGKVAEMPGVRGFIREDLVSIPILRRKSWAECIFKITHDRFPYGGSLLWS